MRLFICSPTLPVAFGRNSSSLGKLNIALTDSAAFLCLYAVKLLSRGLTFSRLPRGEQQKKKNRSKNTKVPKITITRTTNNVNEIVTGFSITFPGRSPLGAVNNRVPTVRYGQCVKSTWQPYTLAVCGLILCIGVNPLRAVSVRRANTLCQSVCHEGTHSSFRNLLWVEASH